MQCHGDTSSFTRSALAAHASKRINDDVGQYDQCVKLTLKAAHGGAIAQTGLAHKRVRSPTLN
jgi:hypothetical protein